MGGHLQVVQQVLGQDLEILMFYFLLMCQISMQLKLHGLTAVCIYYGFFQAANLMSLRIPSLCLYSGTYNNQWMVLDYDRVKVSPKDLLDGVLWVAEQIPGKVMAKDQVQFLEKYIF